MSLRDFLQSGFSRSRADARVDVDEAQSIRLRLSCSLFTLLGMLIWPGIRLMRRISYKLKFSVVAVCVLIPTAAMAWVLFGLLSHRIHQLDDEQVGVTWVQALNAADLTLTLDAFTDASWREQSQSERDRLFDALAGRLWRDASGLAVPDAMVQAFEHAPGACPTASSQIGRNDLPGMTCIEQVRTWVYDHSGLVLDPSMESYYLGHVLAVSGPSLNAALRVLATSLQRDGEVNEQALGFALDTVSRRLETARREVERAAPVHHGLERQMASLAEVSSQIEIWQGMNLSRRPFRRVLVEKELKRLGPALQGCWGGVEATMAAELQSQSVQARRERAAVVGGLLFALLSMFYLFTSFYLATLRDIRQLDRATRSLLQEAAPRMTDDSVRQLQLPSRDELSAVSESFLAFSTRVVSDNQRLRQLEAHLSREKSRLEAALQDLSLAQSTLVETEKMASLGGLVAGIAHEVNTPLGVAVTSASHLMDEVQALQDRLDSAGLRKSDLLGFLQVHQQLGELITRNLARASELIKSFKTMSVDQSSEARRSFELSAYLQDVLRSLRSLYARRPIEVTLVCRTSFQMDSYPGAVAQIMTNLVSNALAHAFDADGAGRIDIELEPGAKAGDVRLIFADNGCGIGAAHLNQVFDPFFTTARGRGGSGLGLSIVHTLATQQLGGRVQVSSEPGRGTRFVLTLPASAPERSPQKSSTTVATTAVS